MEKIICLFVLFLSFNISYCEEVNVINLDSLIKKMNYKCEQFDKTHFYIYGRTIKKNGKVIKIEEINDKELFFIHQGMIISNDLLSYENSLKNIMSQIKEEKNKKILETYVNKLYDLRKKHAEKLICLASFLPNSNLDSEEKQFLFNKIKSWNLHNFLEEKQEKKEK